MSLDQPGFWVALLQILWIDLLLSGDNAVVIAMACRSLPERQRRWGMILGAGVAVALRVAFASVTTTLMTVPWLKLVGAVLLLWVATKLIAPDDDAHEDVTASDTLWRAVRTIAIADAVMSLDNVIAIAGAAKGSVALIAIGLAVSIPLIVAGSALVMALLDRLPVLVWAGGALLGWIAGEMIVSDPAIHHLIPSQWEGVAHYGAALSGAALALLLGWLRRNARKSREDAVENVPNMRPKS